MGAERLSSMGVVFHVYRQRERPSGKLPVPVSEFIRNLQAVTGLRCGTPTVHERRPSGRSGIEQATTMDGQSLARGIYHSREEMPEDVRASFDQMMSEGRSENLFSSHREHIEVDDGQGGVRTFDSLDDAPPEIRARIESLRSGAMPPGPNELLSQIITVRDAQGNVRTYHSLEEMPPDVRARYEEARHRAGR
jgi:hypothetical protein